MAEVIDMHAGMFRPPGGDHIHELLKCRALLDVVVGPPGAVGGGTTGIMMHEAEEVLAASVPRVQIPFEIEKEISGAWLG